ncbi:MAG: DUF1003 domain-containing protein [Parcubacteria group bacterium]|nr:DUF1003 domain-containing protein [Parcubacteria group bacterium]
MAKPLSLEEVRKHHKPIRNVNLEHKEKLSRLERFAVWITEHIGSMGFFLLILAWTIFWLLWNTVGPEESQFDPFPAFVFWLFISNMIQLLLMPLIMIGQNLQGRHSEARASEDFEVNIKAEKEIEVIVQHLENQGELIQKIASDLESLKQK